MIDSRRGFLSGWSGLSYSSKLCRRTEMESVRADKWTLALPRECLMLDEWLLTNERRKFKSPKKKKTAAFGTKETVITDVKSKASEAGNNWTSRGVHLCSPMCTCGCLCPLKLHSSLSGLCSQRAHLEMRFKTAINVELSWSENTGGTTELFLVQITGCFFCFCFFVRERRGGCEGGAQTEWLLAMCFFVHSDHRAESSIFSPLWILSFFSSSIIIQTRCPSSDNDCLTTEIGN